jgi:hypothetical protein
MSTSQAAIDKLPKQFPFSNRRKVMIPQGKYNFGYHVDILGKYSKKIPKREKSVLDHRTVQSGMYWNDTTKYNRSD